MARIEDKYRMRVVLVTGIYPPDIGGPATHSVDLQADLQLRGHTVSVLTLHEDGNWPHQEDSSVRYPRSWPWPLRLAAVCWWLLRHRHSYDVVYATGLHEGAVMGARLAGRPVVVKVVGDPVWERAQRLGLTAVGFDEFQSSRRGGLRVRAMRRFRNWAIAHATSLTAPSEYLARVVEGWLGGPADVGVIRNGVKVLPPNEPAARRDDGFLRAVYAGRLVSHKRIDTLVAAVTAVEGVVLDVIGEGPERQALEDCARRLCVEDRVRFLGPAEHAEVMRILAAADVLVMASAYEGLPHVIVEASACGIPVVAPDVGGVREVVEDGVNGLIVEQPDSDGLARALRRLREDPALLRDLSEGARRNADKWRFEKCADRIESLLARAIARKPRAVFFGKGGLPSPTLGDYRKKLDIICSHLAPTIVTVGPAGVRRLGGTRVVALPNLRPPLLGGVIFYALGAPVVMFLAARKRRAVVCQSPYEGFCLILCSRLIPRAIRPRVMVEVHGDWRAATRLYGSRARRCLSTLADRAAAWAICRADRVRVISDYTESLVREVGYRGELERFITFSDFSIFSDSSFPPIPKEPRVAFVGGLEPSKGLDVLLRAWPLVVEKLSSSRLTIAGDGPMLETMRREAEALGVGSTVDFMGRVSRSEVRRVLDCSSLLALPSRSEGLGRVILEAYARGRPVVGTRVGGIPEAVEHGRTGLVVPPDDPEALAGALIELLGDPRRLCAMGTAARHRVAEWDPLAEFEAGIERLSWWIVGNDG